MLIIRGGRGAIDIERDLDCVPLDEYYVGIGNDNTAKLNAAFAASATVGASGKHYAFIVPNKCFPIGDTPLALLGGTALVGSGGIGENKQEILRNNPAISANYKNGPTLMRLQPSSNPMIRLSGYGSMIDGLTLSGADWYSGNVGAATFVNVATGNQSDPYFSAVGIEIRKEDEGAAGGTLSAAGHHTISAALEFCTIGIKTTFDMTENHADVCTFPRLDFHECPTGFQCNNGQSVGHRFGHVFYQSTFHPVASVLAECKIFDLQQGGRVSVGACTVVGPCTVVNTNDVDENTGALTIDHIYCDVGCFQQTRKMRLLNMESGTHRQFFLRITGAFSWSTRDLGTLWYNTDASPLWTGNLNNANRRVDIFGMATADKVSYGMFQ